MEDNVAVKLVCALINAISIVRRWMSSHLAVVVLGKKADDCAWPTHTHIQSNSICFFPLIVVVFF